MANKKSLKDAATAGTSVFDTIIKGAQNVQDAQDVQDVQDAPRVFKEKVQLERLNLKIPAEIKEYLSEYCTDFGYSVDELLSAPFTIITPDSKNPYKQMYVAN